MENFTNDHANSKSYHNVRHKNPGPVIMISRECGCSAKRIATKLTKILSGYSYLSDTKTDIEWKWVSKEILQAVAMELKMDHSKVKDVFLSEAKLSIEDVTTAFLTDKIYNADDQQVIDSVRKVIHSIAEHGNFIIVGQAGSHIAKDISRKLSIKLQAPLEWRINRIMQISNMSHDDAQGYVLSVDRQRELFIEHIMGQKPTDNDFDLIFNYSTLKDDHIVDAIVNVAKNRGLIE